MTHTATLHILIYKLNNFNIENTVFIYNSVYFTPYFSAILFARFFSFIFFNALTTISQQGLSVLLNHLRIVSLILCSAFWLSLSIASRIFWDTPSSSPNIFQSVIGRNSSRTALASSIVWQLELCVGAERKICQYIKNEDK